MLDGAASTINIATAGKKAVLLIAGNAGQALSLQFSNFAPSVASTSLYYTVYNTANASVGSGHPELDSSVGTSTSFLDSQVRMPSF